MIASAGIDKVRQRRAHLGQFCDFPVDPVEVFLGDLLDLRAGAVGIGIEFQQAPAVLDGETKRTRSPEKRQLVDVALPKAAVA